MWFEKDLVYENNICLFGKYLSAEGYMLVCAAFLFIAAIGVCIWLKKKGTKIFEEL